MTFDPAKADLSRLPPAALRLPPSGLQTFFSITQALSFSFSFDELKELTAAWRQKELRVEDDVMPAGMTGYSIALRDCDLACARWDLNPRQKRGAHLHEIGHFLQKHLPNMSDGPTTRPYNEFILRRDLTNALRRERFYDTLYNDLREQGTELLAILCYQCIDRYENLPSRHILLYHGFTL